METTQAKFSPVAMTLLRSNLGHYDSDIPLELENYLEALLNYAYDDFARMGIHLEVGKLKDDMDQMVFAAWMYRSGVDGSGKNEMLKSIIRNRQVSGALASQEADA